MTLARAAVWIGAIALGACTAPVVPNEPADARVAPRAAESPAPETGIVGTRWVGIVREEADHRTLPRLEFVRAGRLSGYTGCNMLSGAWALVEGEVKVGALVMTKRLCLGEEGEVEKRFLAALRDGRGRRDGERLVFTGPRGERFEFSQAAAT